MQLATIDVVVVLVYFVAIFGLAQFVSREKAGHQKNSTDYFLASRNLPWWAIGASLIAANISAGQIVGMSGSGYAIGLAISSYEWMAALTILIVGKFFLPIFLKNEIYTMPQFLEQRYGPTTRTILAIFWLGLYVFVNLTSIIWLGSIAVTQVAGIDQNVALLILGLFALFYQLRGGLKAVALTDIVQVTLLVLGGLMVSWITLTTIGHGSVIGGFHELTRRVPDHFNMILSPSDPHFDDLPGISVLIGGMWIANLSYWGFNQYIIQRALAAKSLPEAQKGVVFAAFLKLITPLVIVVPGIAAVLLAPDLAKPDDAYPTMMRLLNRYPGSRLRRADRRNRCVYGVEDQLDLDDLHARSLCQVQGQEEQCRGYGRQRSNHARRTPPRARRPHHRMRRAGAGADHRAAAARPFGPGIPVHPGIYRLLHAGHHRDLPARPVLEARERSRRHRRRGRLVHPVAGDEVRHAGLPVHEPDAGDRKSTRLNSSHMSIS